MVESPVVVPTAAGVHGHLRSEWEPRGVVQVVDAVEVWLERWMGDHRYTAVGPVRVTSTR